MKMEIWYMKKIGVTISSEDKDMESGIPLPVTINKLRRARYHIKDNSDIRKTDWKQNTN